MRNVWDGQQVINRLYKYGFPVLLPASATLALWMLRDSLTPANNSLIFLLVVLIVAMYQGTIPSLLAALISFLCFNFFLVQPLYTFLVADPHDVLDLVIFLICAALTGQLASYARKQTETARQRAYEQTVLYDLTSAFNQLTDVASIQNALKQVLSRVTYLRSLDILPYTTGPVPSADQAVLYLLLQVNERIYGTLRVTFDVPPDSSLVQLMSACALQASIAFQRIELSNRVQQSRSFEEADRLKTALLHAVSHDLRTPITIIKTSASNLLALRRTLPEQEQIDMLKTIDTEADQLNKMVGNLLDISRLKAGMLSINYAWNSVEEVAGDVAARTWQLTQQERVRLVFPELPLISFDYGLILQALSNLVDNSLRYEPPDTQIEISAQLDKDKNEIRVFVRNHGPTLPVEERAVVMEPFYHGKDGNTGLGLAIAKGIIEAHHGRLWIEDTPGGGVTFTFSLPLKTMEKDATAKGSA